MCSEYTDSYLIRPLTVYTAVGPRLVQVITRVAGVATVTTPVLTLSISLSSAVTVWGIGKRGKGLLGLVVKF